MKYLFLIGALALTSQQSLGETILSCQGFLRTYQKDSYGQVHGYQDAKTEFPLKIEKEKNIATTQYGVFRLRKVDDAQYVGVKIDDAEVQFNLNKYTGSFSIMWLRKSDNTYLEATCKKKEKLF